MTNKWLTWAGDTLKLDLRWGNVCMCVTLSEYDFHFEVIIQHKEPSILKVTHLRLFIVFQIHNPIYTLICGSVEWRQCKRRANHVNETYRWHVKKMERWLSKSCRCNQNYNSQFCILMGLRFKTQLLALLQCDMMEGKSYLPKITTSSVLLHYDLNLQYYPVRKAFMAQHVCCIYNWFVMNKQIITKTLKRNVKNAPV